MHYRCLLRYKDVAQASHRWYVHSVQQARSFRAIASYNKAIQSSLCMTEKVFSLALNIICINSIWHLYHE